MKHAPTVNYNNEGMSIPNDKAVAEETRRRRRLQFLMDLTLITIAQTAMNEDEAWALIWSAKAAALRMFPGKELAFDMIYLSRFRRLMAEKYAGIPDT
jgi:hypothetical protein